MFDAIRFRLSRLRCRLFDHDWSNDHYFALCLRDACRGFPDAIREH